MSTRGIPEVFLSANLKMNTLSHLVPDENLEGLLPGVLGGDHEGGAPQHRLLIHSDRGMPEKYTRKLIAVLRIRIQDPVPF
jgi:hypothetical protein